MDALIPENSFALVIVSAGKGERFQSACPKQYQVLKPPATILETSLQAFLPLWNSFIQHLLVVQPDHEKYWQPFIEQEKYKGLTIVYGGAQRYQSVYNALEKCASSAEFVLIHDSVRPLVSKSLIMDVMKNTLTYKACIPALQVRDTVKEVDSEGFVVKTVDRNILRMIQTPQGFHLKTLLNSMRKYRDSVYTDESVFLENNNQPVKTIPGDFRNIKITYPEDMKWAEFYAGNKYE